MELVDFLLRVADDDLLLNDLKLFLSQGCLVHFILVRDFGDLNVDCFEIFLPLLLEGGELTQLRLQFSVLGEDIIVPLLDCLESSVDLLLDGCLLSRQPFEASLYFFLFFEPLCFLFLEG